MNQSHIASAAGTGFAAALVVVVVWGLQSLGVTVPDDVSNAFVVVISTSLGYYLHKDLSTPAAPPPAQGTQP